MPVAPVSRNKFDGFCEVCGDAAELRDSHTTALLQAQGSGVLSSIGTRLVRCLSGDHAYFVLDWTSQVQDPFSGRETAEIEATTTVIPPPPPPKEDA